MGNSPRRFATKPSGPWCSAAYARSPAASLAASKLPWKQYTRTRDSSSRALM